MGNTKIILCTVLLFAAGSRGIDPFEYFVLRPECYQTEQPGCNTEFTAAHPEVSRSHDNLTEATTRFYMFSNNNPDVPELMHKCGGGLPNNTRFNPDCNTEIYAPGFASGICNYAIFRELKDQRLESGCWNVILVDWMWGNTPDLVEAKENIPIVAKQCSIVIRYLKKRYGLGPEKFVLTGHSYGAHMAGLIGQMEKVDVINGIDPAGVTYSEQTPLNERLDAGDAKCVQVIHTNAGGCFPYFGVNFPCGTMDFWVNGGLIQESCYAQTWIAFLKQDYVYGFFSLFPPACYHFQALQYYKASMNPTDGCKFTGVQCSSAKEFKDGRCRDCGARGENCAIMGANACDCKRARGNYYLNTDKACPYCNNSGLLNADKVRCARMLSARKRGARMRSVCDHRRCAEKSNQ